MKIIVGFHPSFYSTHSLPDKPVIYSDLNLLLSKYIFSFTFCAPINNPMKTTKIAISSKDRFRSADGTRSHPLALACPRR
jgi:hypothetical protein